MRKDITIGAAVVPMESNGYLPIFYKKRFGADMFHDIRVYSDAAKKGDADFEAIFKLAYAMARLADPELPDFEDWLAQYELFDLVGAAEEILKLWQTTNAPTSKTKKK